MVPAEFRGLARGFLSKVRGAHLAHIELVDGFTSLIRKRSDKYPLRSVPADMLSDLARRWRDGADPYRIGFANKLKGCKGVVSECRIGYSGLIHHGWDEAEPNAVIVFVSLNVTKSSAQVVARVEHSFSLHSLARFYERSGYSRDCDVVHAMIGALLVEPKNHEIGEDVPLGSWRGSIRVREVGEDQLSLWCARTWIG